MCHSLYFYYISIVEFHPAIELIPLQCFRLYNGLY